MNDKLERIEELFKKTGENLRKYGDSPQAKYEIFGDFYCYVEDVLKGESK